MPHRFGLFAAFATHGTRVRLLRLGISGAFVRMMPVMDVIGKPVS